MFRFKQFGVVDDNSAMKVGVDSVLLGAWAEVECVGRVLDIGAGCGLLSLMMAQRNRDAKVVGVEISAEAVGDAKRNFEASEWSDRLLIVNADVNSYYARVCFDSVVSNPPYFDSNRVCVMDEDRRVARHGGALSFEELVRAVGRLMSERGRFSLVLPYEYYRRFGQVAADNELFECRRLCVSPKVGSSPNRVLLEYGRRFTGCADVEFLCLRDESGNYSREFKELTREFYLTDI